MSITELDPIEKTFQALDTESTFQNIAIISELDKEINELDLRKKINSIALNYPKLKHILKGNYWVEKNNLNIQDHVEVKKFNTLISQSELSDYLNLDIKLGKKLWKVILYNCQEGKSYLATIFHHSFTDGMGMIEFNKDLFTKKGQQNSKSSRYSYSNNKKINYIKSLFYVIKDIISFQASSEFNGRNSDKRKFSFIKLDLNKINEIRKAKKLSLHEYMMSIFINALKTNLKAKKLSVLTPISHRNPKSSKTFGNYITGMPINFNIKKENIYNYVSKKFRQELNSKKNQAYIKLSKILALFPYSLRKKLCNFTAKRTHLICTSVPSSRDSSLGLAGARVIAQYPVAALMQGHGLALGYTRYNNNINICMISDPNIIEKPQDIVNRIKVAANE